jgi:SAM-dependent methyltransferase
MSEQQSTVWSGFCPICGSATLFRADGPWLRETLFCTRCPSGSVPRERALMLVLIRLRPNWRNLTIHESSPAPRGVSPLLARECPGYVASQFFPGIKPGTVHQGFRCENLEAQTFGDETFDLVVTQDVLEHVFNPDQAHREIHRTLRLGGLHIHTTPIYGDLAQSVRKAELTPSCEINYLAPAEHHGNPVDSSGSLVTFHYGRDLPRLISEWAPFSVEIMSFNDRTHGICGEFTDVIVCRKVGPRL